MIRSPKTLTLDDLERSPQQALADALGGTVLGRDSIQVGTSLVVASVLGVVRVDGHPVGMWSEPTQVLAERVRAVMAA